jgi:hypothetical protein
MTITLALILNLFSTTDPNHDGLGIIIFVIDLAIFWLILTALFNRKANSKAAIIWPKLAPYINGVFHPGIGLTTPFLSGEYRGLPIRACVRVSSRSRWYYEYTFEITAKYDTRGGNWEVRYDKNKKGEKALELIAKDPLLKRRLSQSDLMTLLSKWKVGTSVKYKGAHGTLLFRQHIHSREDLPAPDEFEMELEMVNRLAKINRQVNEDPDGSNSFIHE